MTYYIFDEVSAKTHGYDSAYLEWFKGQGIDPHRPCKFEGPGERETLAYFTFTTRLGVLRERQHMHRQFFRPHLPEPFNESDWL